VLRMGMIRKILVVISQKLPAETILILPVKTLGIPV
jgi:hypothetical protein